MTTLHGRSLSVLLCLVALVGCGGGGGGNGGGSNNGGNGNGNGDDSPFANSYAGVYNAPATPDNGTVDLDIGVTGEVSGTVFSTPRNAEGPISGIIASDGTFTGTMQIAGTPEATLTGTLAKGTNGHLAGTLQSTSGGTTNDVSFDLAPKI